MSNQQNDIYLEEKKVELEQIIAEGRWGEVQPLYIEMEDEGMGQFVSELSQIMTNDDVREYKKWDERVNGSSEVQADDSGQDDRGGDYLELVG